MRDSNPSAPSRVKASRRSRLPTVAAVLGAALLTAFAVASLAEAGRGFGGHGRHGFDAERAHDRAEFAVGWVLSRVDATDEQELRIQQIVASAIDELTTLKQQHGGQHDAFLELLVAEKVDRKQLEQLRAQQLVLAETASGLIATALADVADTLSVEQRAELIEHAGRHQRGHGWH